MSQERIIKLKYYKVNQKKDTNIYLNKIYYGINYLMNYNIKYLRKNIVQS